MFVTRITGANEISGRLRQVREMRVRYAEVNLRTLGRKVAAAERRELATTKTTGGLERSVTFDVDGRAERLVIGPTAKQGQFIYTGTKPHWAPIAPLKQWARIKLGDERLAYPVQKSIAQYGTSVYIEHIGLGDGYGGNPYPERTLKRGDVQIGIQNTAMRLGRDILAFIAGKQ